jgi:uncharacterized protein (DUF342 family)
MEREPLVSETENNENAEHADNTILYIRQGDQKDGYAEVSFTPDGMSATASFFPPIPGGAFLTYPLVAQTLEQNGIVNGVLHDSIQKSILDANSSHTPVKTVAIAKGTPPETEIPEHFVLRKDILERKPEIDPELARIDWHSISAFTIVKAKDPIARRIPKVDGKAGINIRGEESPFTVQAIQQISAGKNVIDHSTGLFAGKSGRLSIESGGTVVIEEVLTLKKGVDFTTGNITFPGDVILQGKIADGFKVYTGGSLIAGDVVDVTEIVCKKDLIVQAGLIGRQKAQVRVGGTLQAKYIQNCRVAVRGDVVVPGSIIQSTVYTMGMIKMGDTGKLVGCECIVIGGVQALEVGNARGAKTYIRCGTDFTIQQELDIANEQIKTITVKIQQLEEVYIEEPLEIHAHHIEELKIRKNEISNRIPAYLTAIDKNDEAFVEVRGTVFPGTEIEICHVSHKVLKQQKAVVFRLDKSRGSIVTEPYKKGAKQA